MKKPSVLLALLTTLLFACSSPVDDEEQEAAPAPAPVSAPATEAKPENGFAVVGVYSCPQIFPYEYCNGFGQCYCSAYRE